jgi:hypothetical protein
MFSLAVLDGGQPPVSHCGLFAQLERAPITYDLESSFDMAINEKSQTLLRIKPWLFSLQQGHLTALSWASSKVY